MTLQSLQASIYRISNVTLPAIADQLNNVFGISIDRNAAFSGPCINQIEYIAKFLNTEVSD